ncbi:metallophosphoesterase family protein [Aestuariirhabdus litorea]|uniref:Metallophosphoesterase n=1 Tax=Aestuariirhabdus litorea TaxID=2528527 RepID=A0A3P3VRK8_9GAMM|nr:metallophosphoesterase family protein [Aestuariirhabdus litorea]RRJ85365.1 metallophosphoesterase [Aestuariirhabdus litorea]RWW98588.1 metallophosphatase family protein [Endozoicomonadaceae bacterium GTF-13]
MSPFKLPGPGPLLVFGGPYSNLEATRTLQARAEALGVPPENCLCTGDLIAYCARPAETLDAIQAWGCTSIMGNCEESLVQQAADCGCGFEAGSACDALSQGWFRFARARINEQQRAWMATLPQQLQFRWHQFTVTLVHGAPSRINRFLFASSETAEKQKELESSGAQLLLAGHCGLPFGQTIAGPEGSRYWLNSGAIGMPANDGTPDGWYLLLEPEGDSVRASWHRLPYNAPSEQQAMRAAGLDNGYASALTSGLWPSMDVLPEPERLQQGTPLQPQALMLTPNTP